MWSLPRVKESWPIAATPLKRRNLNGRRTPRLRERERHLFSIFPGYLMGIEQWFLGEVLCDPLIKALEVLIDNVLQALKISKKSWKKKCCRAPLTFQRWINSGHSSLCPSRMFLAGIEILHTLAAPSISHFLAFHPKGFLSFFFFFWGGPSVDPDSHKSTQVWWS